MNFQTLVLAGNLEPWREEIRQKCRPGIYEGTFKSDDLCRVQVSQHSRGFREAQLSQTIYGWCVRLRSGLCADQLLLSGRLLGRKVSREEALEFGRQWVAEAPEHHVLTETIDEAEAVRS